MMVANHLLLLLLVCGLADAAAVQGSSVRVSDDLELQRALAQPQVGAASAALVIAVGLRTAMTHRLLLLMPCLPLLHLCCRFFFISLSFGAWACSLRRCSRLC